MDNTTFAYLFGAFILGFLVAWIAGRSGPNHALKECEANGQELQRKLKDRDGAVAKAEAQLIERQAQLDRLSAGQASATAALQAAETQLATANEAAATMQLSLRENEGEVLRLRAELRHISDAWAGARERSTELDRQLELADVSAAAMAVETAEAVVAAEEAIAVAEAEEVSASAQIDELASRLDVMTRELDLTRAAAARTAAMALLRPQLTPARREEYAALADDPDQVVQALHARDIAVADAVNETSYLRRSLGIMTAMGSELADALEKRNRDYDAVALRLSRMTLNPPAPQPAVEASVAPIEPAAEAVVAVADSNDEMDAAFADLQRKIDELQTQLGTASSAQGDLEGRLQAQGLTYENLVTRLAEISAELESLNADEDAAPATTPEPAAEAVAAPDADLAPVTPGDDVLKRLTAGVALAITAIQRKNAHVSGLVAERSALESGLAEKEQVVADQSTQLQTLQDDLSSRSVKLDALSLRASSLEVEVEQARHDRAQLDDQMRQLAEELTALADQYAPLEEPEASAAPEAPVTAEVPIAPDAPVVDAADMTAPAGVVVAEPVAEAAAPPAEVAAQEVAAQEDVSMTGAALLAAAIARIRAAVAKQERDLADASDRLTTLADQLDTVDSEEAALSATISDQESALEDAGQQLVLVQGDLAAAVAERDGFQQRVTGYQAQLRELLAQYAEAEPVELPAADAVPLADAAVASDAPLAETDAPAAEAASDAPTAEEVVTPAVDAVTAAIAAIGALFARKQASLSATSLRLTDLEGQLGDLAGAKNVLDTTLAEKEQALASTAESYSSLQDEFGKRSVQIDALGLHASSLEADLDIARLERAKFESQIQAVADRLGAIAATYAEAPVTEPVAAEPVADTATPAAAPDAADAAPVALPLATQLETNAAAVVAVVESKSAALAAMQTQVAALQQDLTTSGSDLDAAATHATDLAAQLASAEAAKADLDNSLSEISQKLQALRVEFDDAPAPAPDAAPTAADAERRVDVGPAAALAGITGIGVVLARRRQAMEESKAQVAQLEQQVADLTAQLQAAELDRDQIKQNLDASGQQIEALNLQIADLQAQLDAAVAERDAVQANVAGIGHTLEELGAAADEDDDEKLDSAVAGLVKAGLVAGGATALAGSIRNKRASVQDANAQVEQLQQQLAAATAAESELQTRASAQMLDLEATSSQMNELQAKLDALAAEKASIEETMQRRLEETQVHLQSQDSMIEGLRRQLELEAEWQRKSPFLTGLIQKLNKWTGVKAVAASAALEEQVIPKTVKLPENLTYVTHIGKTYADRLHDADVGTFWELAFMPDEDLAQILKLNELQLMGMNFDEVRASARQLAVENGTVGHMWERVAYDDFEKIKGIGSKMEQRLYNAGVTTYAQIAAMTPEQLDDICQPKPPLRPKYDQWIEQAQAFVTARAQQEALAASEVVAEGEAAAAAETAAAGESPAEDAG